MNATRTAHSRKLSFTARHRHEIEIAALAFGLLMLGLLCLGVVSHRTTCETFARSAELIETCEEHMASMEGFDLGLDEVADLYL